MKPSFAQPKNISEDQTSNPKKKFLNQASPHSHPVRCVLATPYLHCLQGKSFSYWAGVVSSYLTLSEEKVFVTSNQLSHLQVAEKYTNTQVLSVKQRLKYVSGSQKFPKNQKWKIFCHFMQCKLAFLSVGIHQGTFLRHNCTCTEWCGVLKMSSLLVAHGNRASPLLKKGKQRKQGLQNCVAIFPFFSSKICISTLEGIWTYFSTFHCRSWLWLYKCYLCATA